MANGRTSALALAFTCIALTLAGCAGLPTAPACPDLGGTYANQANDSDARLSALLLPNGPARAARTVTLAQESEPGRLVVAAGAQRAVLAQGSDFTCKSGVLQLAEPMQRRINLGSFLTQDVETSIALTKDADGTLVASTSTREHSVIWGKGVTGPLRQGAVVRWRPVAAPAAR